MWIDLNKEVFENNNTVINIDFDNKYAYSSDSSEEEYVISCNDLPEKIRKYFSKNWFPLYDDEENSIGTWFETINHFFVFNDEETPTKFRVRNPEECQEEISKIEQNIATRKENFEKDMIDFIAKCLQKTEFKAGEYYNESEIENYLDWKRLKESKPDLDKGTVTSFGLKSNDIVNRYLTYLYYKKDIIDQLSSLYN